MKRVLVVLIAVAVVVAFAGVAMAGISNTKHNLSSASGATSVIKGAIDEICIYCHTPHGGDTSIPLWNRSAGSLTVTPYSSTTMSPTMGTTVTGVSRACFSCHDGSTSINSMLNVGGSAYYVATPLIPGTSMSNLGTDLQNDHPVGISMDVIVAGRPTEYQNTGLYSQTFGATNTVECASCHDVHSENALFLRALNTDSQICLDCHIK